MTAGTEFVNHADGSTTIDRGTTFSDHRAVIGRVVTKRGAVRNIRRIHSHWMAYASIRTLHWLRPTWVPDMRINCASDELLIEDLAEALPEGWKIL